MSGSAKAKGSDADLVQGRSYISDRRPGYSGSGNTDPSMRPSTSDSSRPGFVSGSGTRSGITGASSSSRSGRIGAPHSFSSGHSDERSQSDNLVGPGSGLRLRKEDVTQAYERFRRLGMPSEITAEVFEQLIIGSSPPSSSTAAAASASRQGQGQGSQGRGDVDRVGAAIVLLSERLVGRQEARRMRGVIAK